jgi:hypothetical protein
MRKIAITGIRKAAEGISNYLGRKSLRGMARANRTAEKAYDTIGRGVSRATDATANLVRKAARASDAFDNATLGPIGKATRNASAAVVKATRHARPRARETMGQINRRKGIVNKVHKPSQMDSHVKAHEARMMRYKGQGNNINFRDESVRPRKGDYMNNRGDYMTNGKPAQSPKKYDYQRDHAKYAWKQTMPSDFRSYVKSSGPKYTSKQVRAGRKVVLGAAAGYAASEYYKAKKSNR